MARGETYSTVDSPARPSMATKFTVDGLVRGTIGSVTGLEAYNHA